MSDALRRVIAAYQDVDRISNLEQRIPYVFGGGHNARFLPDPGFDCSGFVSAVFHHAGILGIPHVWFPFDTVSLANWGMPGQGRFLTMWVVNTPQQEHCFLDFHLFNRHIYPNQYAMAAHAGTVVGWMGADTTGFTPRRWPGA